MSPETQYHFGTKTPPTQYYFSTKKCHFWYCFSTKTSGAANGSDSADGAGEYLNGGNRGEMRPAFTPGAARKEIPSLSLSLSLVQYHLVLSSTMNSRSVDGGRS